jgi:plasmid stability protein
MQPKWIHIGCTDVACLVAMGKTLTLKNLPDALHARLAAAAKRHRRSLNNEAIVCLEAGLGAPSTSVEEQLERIRALRESLGPHIFDPDEIDAFKREGRP